MNLREYRRRTIIPLLGLALAAYYSLVFVPLQRRAQKLDLPLQTAWQKLAASLDQRNASTIDFRQVTNQLNETRQALGQLDSARQRATARLELGPNVRARMNGPFSLVDYESERSKEFERLAQLAKEQHVALEPPVFAGFPEHTMDVQQPALLWAALSFVDSLLATALRSNVVAIHSLTVPLALTNSPPPENAGQWTEIPLQVEFTAPFAEAARVIQSLPLRANEIQAAGLPPVPADKPPLFVDGLVIKKQSPEKPDEVRVWLRVVGFVSRE